MPAFRYNKEADHRDQKAASLIRDEADFYSGHSDQHLRNAHRYARGCSGSEADAREKAAMKEMRRRGIA